MTVKALIHGLPSSVTQVGALHELRELVRSVDALREAVFPLGGQTTLDFGLPPSRPGIAIDLRNLNHVIDYPARDMTITVQAGITIAKLQELLRAENQRLPIDAPLADRATLGGVLATNTSGPRRYGFGSLRDYVIGISAVNDRGEEIKAGGRVVKNVAGYDLCKLFIGSLGTLGIISQVTLKLRPLPEEQALVTLGCQVPNIEDLLDRLHASRTRPACIELLNQPAAQSIKRQPGVALPENEWVLAIGFEDNRVAVNWQVQQLLKELATTEATGVEARTGPAGEPLWRGLVEFPAAEVVGSLTFKANMLPTATAAFCRLAAELQPDLLLQAHAGNGIVIGHAPADLTLDAARTMLKRLTDAAVAAHGNVVLLRCPTEWKTDLPVWGAPRGDLWLMKEVKDKLDPKRIFNPGRFIGGL